jgi:hypothetical protein
LRGFEFDDFVLHDSSIVFCGFSDELVEGKNKTHKAQELVNVV